MNEKYETYNDGYYHFGKDLEDYPDAWCYVVWSKRGPGKTYSSLWYSYYNNIPILYMKRTVKDVKFICEKLGNITDKDKSPYAPINRDKGTNVKSYIIEDGFGGFYNCTPEGEPVGSPISYISALSAVKSFKGFDMSECEWILLDEFIPQTGEIVRHVEGEMLLDMYMTLQRDREKRGRGHLKLVLFANAEEISTPITNALEIVDDMADLSASGQSHMYLKDRGIMLHHITNDEVPITEAEKTGIYAAMYNTAWGQKTFEGNFANNDFSNVCELSLKHFKPLMHIHFKRKDYYIYVRSTDGMYYMTAAHAQVKMHFDLNKENDQKLFWVDRGIDIRNRCIAGKMRFQKYSMYDLIVNYKKFFDL